MPHANLRLLGLPLGEPWKRFGASPAQLVYPYTAAQTGPVESYQFLSRLLVAPTLVTNA